MKKLVFFLATSMCFAAFASQDDPGSDWGTSGTPQRMGGVKQRQQLQNAINKEDLSNLSNKLCSMIEITFGHEDAAEKVEDVLLKHLEISRSTSDYKLRIINFWNNKSPYFICDRPSRLKPHARVPQHFMKRVLDLNMNRQIFNEFLLYYGEVYPINVNAVEVHNGQKETVLDYLNDIINDPSRHQHYQLNAIKLLKEILEEDYGAKTANQLD